MSVKQDMHQELHHPGEAAEFQEARDTDAQLPGPHISEATPAQQAARTAHIHVMPIRIPSPILPT